MSYCTISSQINVQDCKYLKYIIKKIYLSVHAVQLSIIKVAVASNFHLAAIVVENNNTCLHVQTSKGITNRNCIQPSFTLELVCSIYIMYVQNGKTNRIWWWWKETLFNITFRVAPHRAIFALFHFFLDAKLFF